MKRFLLLVAGAALLTACETASEIDAVASGGSGSSEATSASSSAASTSDSGSSSTTSSSSESTSADSGSSYSYDTDPKTALIKVGDRVLFGYDSSELDDEDKKIISFLNAKDDRNSSGDILACLSCFRWDSCRYISGRWRSS